MHRRRRRPARRRQRAREPSRAGRGEAFARSDGAWLVTLGDIPLRRAEKQVDWLARLLSVRGIPSYCLERHLLALHRALAAAKLPPREDPDRLATLADRIGSARRALYDAAEWRRRW